MKTVQFHRNKEELRDELLSFLMVGKSRSKSKTQKNGKKLNSKQKFNNKSKQRQLRQVSPKDIISQVQQSIQGPRIKLKLKKKTQNQTNKMLPVQQQQHPSFLPLQQISTKINQNIKKAIEKQLLSSFYISDKSKQVDNRKTAYRQQDDQNDISQQTLLNNKEVINRNSSSNKTKDRQQRCAKIYQERNNRMINSFIQDNIIKQESNLNTNVNVNANLNMNKQIQYMNKSMNKSIKFIPQDEVYIPKSFVTFTVKRKEYNVNSQKNVKDVDMKQNSMLIKQSNKLRSSTSSKQLQTKNQPYQQIQRLKTQQRQRQNKQKHRSLSSVQFQIRNNNEVQKKIAFYNRYSHNKINNFKYHQPSSSSSLKKQSTFKTIKPVKNIVQIRQQQQIQQQMKQSKQLTISQQQDKKISQQFIQENRKCLKLSLRKSIQKSNKHYLEKNNFDRNKSHQQKERQQIGVQQYRTSQVQSKNIPLVKMTQSLYQDKPSLLNSEQQFQLQQPSLSFTSSLNYSTPFPSIQQSDSKQLTINKLSTITKHPQHKLEELSPSQHQYQEKQLKFTQSKFTQSKQDKKNNDILTTSLTKFKEYQQKKQSILKHKQTLNNEDHKINKIKTQLQQQKHKQQEQFNDFDEIFLQSNNIDIDQLRLKQKQKDSQQLKRNKQTKIQIKQNNNKINNGQKNKISNQKQFAQKQIKRIPQFEKLSQVKTRVITLQKEQNTKKITEPVNQKGQEQKQRQDNQEIPAQLSINQSSIQQSVSDFTPQPSLADIKINDEPFIKSTKNQNQKQQQQIQQQKQIFVKPELDQLSQHINQERQLTQIEKHQQQQQLKSQISFNQLQDYEFNQNQNKIEQKKYHHFQDFPNWNYNDNRDNIPQSVVNKLKNIQNQQVKIIPLEIKQTQKSIDKKHDDEEVKQISKKVNIEKNIMQQIKKDKQLPKLEIQTKKQQKNKQIKNQLQSIPKDQFHEEIATYTRPKSTSTNKVRLIQNIQLSSSSSQQEEKYSNHLDKEIQLKDSSKTNQNKQHKLQAKYDQTIQNRYYSSSDEQQQQQQQHQSRDSSQKDISQLKQKPTNKLTLKKQTSIKKTFNNNQSNKNIHKSQLQKNKQKIIPLGIKITKPKDLFPVLQDSQQWNYGSQSVPDIDNSSIQNNGNNKIQRISINNDKNNKIKNQQNKKNHKIQQPIKDQQLDLLQKQFSQPINFSKNSKQQQKPYNNKINITKKLSQQSKSLSDFTESDHKNNSNNLTQQLSDFSQDQSNHQILINETQNKSKTELAVNMKKSQHSQKNSLVENNPPLTQELTKNYKKDNYLNQIEKQRNIVYELKNHVNSLLKRISSEHSISADQDYHTNSDTSKIQNNKFINQSDQKQNHSFLSNQPQIKPVSMSSSGSLVSKQSFVQQYEENNVRESIVRSKCQRQDPSKKKQISNKSKQKSDLYKKYEKDNFKKQTSIETNPLFDFSDKNSSDNQNQRKISSVKKYSQSDSNKSLSNEVYTQQQQQNSQTSLQLARKLDVLKQFDNIAKISQKDFSKNKSYYLKYKEKQMQSQKSFDLPKELPLLKPNTKNKSIERTTNKYMNQSTLKNVNDKKIQQHRESSQGSSGQTINHKQLEIIPESLYVTNAKNTSSSQLKISQMQPRQSLKIKKGLSVSKKMSSNSNQQQSNLSGFGKSSNNGSSGSGIMKRSQSQHNQSAYAAKDKGLENQFLWNFIMKK